MAKLLLGIAIAVMIATAALGFMAKGNIDKLQSNLKQSREAQTRADSAMRTAQAGQKTAEEKEKAASAALVERETELTTRKTEIEGLNAKMAEATAAASAKQAELDTANKKLAEMATAAPGEAPMSQEELASLRTRAASLERELAESRQVQETLNTRTKDAEEKLQGAQRRVQEYQQTYVRQGLSGRIVAVNPGWNFVVLNIGDRQGLKVGVSLLVQRGSDTIGRARVTSVEPSTAIADIIPSTLRRGVTVQAGDSVIYEGNRQAQQPPQ